MQKLKKLSLSSLEMEAPALRSIDQEKILGGIIMTTTLPNLCFFDNMESFAQKFGTGQSELSLLNTFDTLFGDGAHSNVTPGEATDFANIMFNASHLDNNQIASAVQNGTLVSTAYNTYTENGVQIAHAVTLNYYDSVNQNYWGTDTTTGKAVVLTAAEVGAGGYAEAMFGAPTP